MISIIVPVYNAEEYILKCLDSISKSLEKDLEVIVVDDGSIDNSGTICDHFSKTDSRFHVFHINNSGASAARNYGIERASGEYIIFIDADDYVLANRISTIKEYIGEYDFIYAGYCDLKVSGNKSYTLFDQSFFVEEYREALAKNLIPVPAFVWCGGYRKDIIEDNRIRFETDALIGEDVLFNLAYIRYCKKIRYIANDGYVHRENTISLVHRYYSNRELKEEKECKMLEDFCNCKLLSKRFYYWHVALKHFEIWEKKGDLETKKSARCNLKICYKNNYFRESIKHIRETGSLDEKIETYLMGYYRHKLFNSILNCLTLVYKLKNRNV